MGTAESILDELGGTVQSAAARLLAAQGMHPTMAVALAPFAPPPESDLDRAIRTLTQCARRLTDQQLYRLNSVYEEALRDDEGNPNRHYVNDELETILQESREFDPEPIGPDYETIDAPYMTEREQAALDDRAAHAYGAERLGEAAL